MTYASYRDLETRILMWGDARRITSNGKATGQAKKTVEEAEELLDACTQLELMDISCKDYSTELHKAKDAIGDVITTLVMVAERLTRETGELVDVVQCFAQAYEAIKDRKGYLNQDGIFVKEE